MVRGVFIGKECLLAGKKNRFIERIKVKDKSAICQVVSQVYCANNLCNLETEYRLLKYGDMFYFNWKQNQYSSTAVFIFSATKYTIVSIRYLQDGSK